MAKKGNSVEAEKDRKSGSQMSLLDPRLIMTDEKKTIEIKPMQSPSASPTPRPNPILKTTPRPTPARIASAPAGQDRDTTNFRSFYRSKLFVLFLSFAWIIIQDNDKILFNSCLF